MTFSAERSYKKKKFKGKGKDQDGASKIKYEEMTRLPRERALEVHAEAIARGAKCEQCPLYALSQGPVMGIITPNARLVIVAESPGQHEIDQKVPMVGKSGDVLNDSLIDGGLVREECTITNTILCRPPEEYKAFEKRITTMHELEIEKLREAQVPEDQWPKLPMMPYDCCFPRLQKDIEESTSKNVLAIGNAAIKAVCEHYEVPFGSARKVKPGEARVASLKKQLGAPLTLKDGTVIMCTYHPAFAMRSGSKHYMHVVKDHIRRAAAIAVRGYVDWQEPPYILNPSVEQIEETLEMIRSSGALVSLDIETDKGKRADGGFDPFSCRIRCIGFGAVIDDKEILICVPIRYMSGQEWWSPENKKRVLQACMNVLNENELVGHNLAFDTQVLLRFGLITEENRFREVEDTILMCRNTPDCDLPHDLGFVTSRYFEAPTWKGIFSDKESIDNVTDHDLHFYNMRDVLVVLRLYPKILEDLYRYATTDQYAMDKAMLPHVRDMGVNGLFIDENIRGEMSIQANREAYELLKKIREIVKNPKFNPSSPHQIRKFLFVEKKMIPVFNSKGKDWEEGEDPSTNGQALTKMINQQGGDEQTRIFVTTLLEYKQWMKLKGTYIDSLKVYYPDWSQYGLEVGTAPAVIGPTVRRLKAKERALISQSRWPDEWTKATTKQEKAALINRVEDEIWENGVILPERPALSRLPITYKQHTISSARLASTPNAQNLPKFGKINTHKMIVSPPGHKIVGADMDQVELRLYTGVSGDKLLNKAFAEGMDPHSYNAASMFCRKFGKSVDDTYKIIVGMPVDVARESLGQVSNEVNCALDQIKFDSKIESALERLSGLLTETQIEKYKKGWSTGDKEKKKLRGYAKTFCYLVCIAEGQRVLTDRGLVPIQDVKTSDRVWDGVEWVSHDGVIYKGKEKVITYDGITATPDHKVWLDSGEVVELQEARRYSSRLSHSGPHIDSKVEECDQDMTIVNVYDILNAGPRHRFTVEGRLVSNCYGGAEEKLGETMKNARDKASGKLMFPDLRDEDVAEWYDQWHKLHTETKEWQQRMERVALREGYTCSILGTFRKRFFPGGANKNGATANHQIQCEPKTSMVLTDKGYQTIESLLETGAPVKVYVRDGQWANATIVAKGAAPIWKVKTSNGRETEWSADHKVRRAVDETYEWVCVKDLRPGDIIAKQAARELDYGEYMDEEDAYWSGYCVGNGGYGHDSWTITIGDRWHAPMFDQVYRCTTWLESNQVEYFVEWRRQTDDSTPDESKSEKCEKSQATYAIVRVYSALKTLAKKIGITPGQTAHTKRISDKIWGSSLSARKAFARGFLQADGYIKTLDYNAPAILINMCNKELLLDFQLFFALIGIEGVFAGPYKADKKGHIAWRVTIPGDQTHQALGLGRKALARGGILAPRCEAIKLLKKSSRDVCVGYRDAGYSYASAQVIYYRVRDGGSLGLQQLVNMGVQPTYGWVEVVEVKASNKQENVYTLSVDHEDHSYVCEGIISKNSSGAEIANDALIQIARQIPFRKLSPFSGLFLQVHDYIGVIVPEHFAKQAAEIIEKAFRRKVFGIDITASAVISKDLASQ